MVERHTVETPRRDPAAIPEENVERQGDEQLSVFEWYCPECEDWLGWPATPSHSATSCDDPEACPHADEESAACGYVVCSECGSLADSHEWMLEGRQAGLIARQIFDDDSDIETAFRKALLEDLQQVTEGKSVEDIVAERRELFERYVQTIEDESEDTEQ